MKTAKTIAKHRDGTGAAQGSGINGREDLNNAARLVTCRTFDFHPTRAALALVPLTCGSNWP